MVGSENANAQVVHPCQIMGERTFSNSGKLLVSGGRLPEGPTLGELAIC